MQPHVDIIQVAKDLLQTLQKQMKLLKEKKPQRDALNTQRQNQNGVIAKITSSSKQDEIDKAQKEHDKLHHQILDLKEVADQIG